MPQLLFHAASQHLIGRDEHDADDESDGEGAYQALTHTGLLDLLRWAGAWNKKIGGSREMKNKPEGPLNWILFI